MKKKEILESIKANSYIDFNEFITNGGDYNLKINGKSLLVHALKYQSNNSIYLLLLYGANTSELKEIRDWEKKLEHMDPDFVEMVREIDESENDQNSLTIHNILRESSRLLLGDHPYSYRNVLSHSVRSHAYSTSLMVGIHLFEYRDWDFLMRDIKDIFQCESMLAKDFTPKSDKKYAMIVSASTLEELGEEIPGLSHRITGFLHFLEIPATNLEYQLSEMNKRDALIMGVHFSDNPSLEVRENEQVDIDSKFYDSMKTTISRPKDPIFFSSSYTFNSMGQWDHQLNTWVKLFKKRHGYFPNILLASSATYSRIDLVANSRGKDQMQGPSGQTPSEEEFASMQGFKGNGYELDFCIEEQLGVDTVKLIYDSDPGGGLPIPEEDLDEWMNAIAG